MLARLKAYLRLLLRRLTSGFIKPFENNWAETLQYIAIVCSIVATGLWTYSTFGVLQQREKAEVDLKKTIEEKKKVEVELQELRERIEGTDSSNIVISERQVTLSNGNVGLFITVSVKNTGTNDIHMSWGDTPLTIYKTYYNGDKVKGLFALRPQLYKSILGDQGENEQRIFDDLYLFVGSQKDLSFFVEIKVPGVYLITFKAKVSKKTRVRLEQDDINGVWFSSQFINVENKSMSSVKIKK
ncbi:hypothetical protein ACE1OG_17435 [Aeromonas hydrophila]